MADIRPFSGVRFDPSQTDLGKLLCPPYDAVGPEEAARLRREKKNAIHLELPEGAGAAKYANSARLYRSWSESKLLVRDEFPSLYVCEERFAALGRRRTRRGFFAAMGVSAAAARSVVRHEKTLSKPKADRLRLLQAVRVNLSPIFGIYPDPAGRSRLLMEEAMKAEPAASGRSASGISYRLWRVCDPKLTAPLCRELASKKILIADGHHRYEVSRRYHAAVQTAAAETVLIYLCPEEDPGLVVLPTHRVLSDRGLLEKARGLCRVEKCRSRSEMLRKVSRSANPYAFGLLNGSYHAAEPEGPGGCKSGLCVEWLARHLFAGVSPEDIRYTPDALRACAMAEEARGTAVFVKPLQVAQIRRAVAAVGLLPQKTTYFFPKIATGLVFKPVS